MEVFYRTHNYLIEHISESLVRRDLMDEIDWNDRLIAIKGGRGTGKTDFLLNYAKELRVKNPSLAKHTLYINLSDFYFTEHTLVELAAEFVAGGGQLLLVDQAYKYPNWSRELSQCYYRYPDLHIVFTATAVMRVVEDNKDIGHIVHPYNLRGFSFREYLKGFTNEKQIIEVDKTTSPLSDALSADLKKRGMKFVGSTIIYSYLQAIGVISSHEEECFMYKGRKFK